MHRLAVGMIVRASVVSQMSIKVTPTTNRCRRRQYFDRIWHAQRLHANFAHCRLLMKVGASLSKKNKTKKKKKKQGEFDVNNCIQSKNQKNEIKLQYAHIEIISKDNMLTIQCRRRAWNPYVFSTNRLVYSFSINDVSFNLH